MSDRHQFSIVVLISGSGSNLQAIINAVEAGQLEGKISGVLSNKEEAYGLKRAQHHGILTHTIDHKAFPDRVSFDREMIATIDAWQPDLVVLAGFMRILSEEFVSHYQGRLINIHPSLLPKYKGLNTHQRALDAHDQWHGCSVHYVTPELDGGPVISQCRVPVKPDDSAETLQARVQKGEHIIYPHTIGLIEKGFVYLSDQGIQLAGELAEQSLPIQETLEA